MPKFLIFAKINHSLRRVKIAKIIFCTNRGWRLMLISLFVILGVSNIVALSTASTRGYELKKLEQNIAELKKNNQKLNLQTSNLSSPKLLEEAAKSLGMVRVKEIKYLSPTSGVLVAR